jgi:hypothetical protein
MGGRLFRFGVVTALALCNQSSTLIDICRCLNAKTLCDKINEASYSLKNNCYGRHNYLDSLTRAAEQVKLVRIEDLHLLKSFQLCRPDVELPSRKELIGSLLNQCYNDVEKTVDSYLASSPYCCSTSDGWSNVRNEPILVMHC